MSFSALLPEDGSAPISGWIHSVVKRKWPNVSYEYSGIQDFPSLQSAFQKEGIYLKTIKIEVSSRQWFQDHLLFNDQGALLQMAPIDYDVLLKYPPSFSTFYTLEDQDTYDSVWIEELARDLGRSVKKLKVTRVEGGELISGTRAGEPYVIIDENVIRRAQRGDDKSESRARVAQDLEVKEENLVSLYLDPDEDFPTHLDTWMMALPEGKILIQKDFKFESVASTLREKGFEVVEVLGIFEDVNFFNGFVVRSPKDHQLVVFTNQSQKEDRRLAWEKILHDQGVARVYFVGRWHPSAGIDCAGTFF